MKRSRSRGKGRMRVVTLMVILAGMALILPPLLDVRGGYLESGTRTFHMFGDQVVGLDITAPQQNAFALLGDLLHKVTVVDHSTELSSPLLGLTNWASRGAVGTVRDALQWFDVQLTARQAHLVGLCQPLNGQTIVVQPDPWQYGIASWYGPGFHGRTAASGEIYNMYDRTAAHKTLPLQSLVRVVATRTGNSVVVRINDRGPYVGGRNIDLSYGAKEALNMDDLGAVYLERIDPTALEDSCE